MSSEHGEPSVQNNSQHPDSLYLGWDDWDFDFDGAIWPKGNDQIDPNLSIGIISKSCVERAVSNEKTS